MFTVPDLPYAYNSLDPYIDEATMKLHHDKHHAAYVKNLNDALVGQEKLMEMNIDDLLRNLNKVPKEIIAKVRNNGGGHANHSLFWQIMAPFKGSDNEPSGELLKAINSVFGSFMSFKEKFSQTAATRFGSGWAWLVINNGKLEIMDTPNQDSPLMEHKIPIVTLDVWEHAYYLKYQNRRPEYIQAWWNVVNWNKISQLFMEKLQTASDVV